MNRSPVQVTAAALLLATAPAVMADGETAESERIQQLERQLEHQQQILHQQQTLLDQLQSELQQLKSASQEPVAEAEDPRQQADADAYMASASTVDESGAPAFSISGFVAMDTIYDFDRVDPAYEATLRPTTIPYTPGEFGEDGQFIMSVKQSRLAFESAMETSLGAMTGLIEFDLFGTGDNAGQTAFNFRHAWFTLERWGIGQTWSVFGDISTWPNVLDWWGPAGMILNRNPQLRYTMPFGDSSLAVALEAQNASFNVGVLNELAPTLAGNIRSRTEAPDLTAHYRSVHDWGHVQVAGVARHLAYESLPPDDSMPGVTGPEGSTFGWGLNLTGILNTVGRDQLKWGIQFGDGIASFVDDGGGSNLVPRVGGGPEAMSSYGLMLYYDHYWNDAWSSSIGFSTNNNDLNALQNPDAIEQVTYASTNLIYQPFPSFLAGLEALYGERENHDGTDGTDFRLQFSLRYFFDQDF